MAGEIEFGVDPVAKENKVQPPASGRGWGIIDVSQLKTPPEGLAASVYLIAIVIALPALLIGIIGFFAFGYEMFIGATADRLEAANFFFQCSLRSSVDQSSSGAQ